ncbi:type II secretion system protein [Blautia sp. SC05B48]|uniref:type II secretion system protein n=2 Tax=Blautia TaxID=572511 RepID=UPI0010FFA7EA|nr:type II secretion system protein [Blautia sp. SC05B48]QCU03306.1 type II secretion system protein [Blautia sp. SC05B48]
MTENKKNSGMTLIEVIVAVSIFSIAAVVLFRGFVTSGLINRKSALYMEATAMAENIMEEVRAKDFGDLSLAFNYPIDKSSSGKEKTRLSFLDSQIDQVRDGSLGVREVLKDHEGYSGVRLYQAADGEDTSRVTASVISEDNGRTYTFNPRENGENASKYYFQLTNVKNDVESFDALLEFDGSKDSGYSKKTASNNEYGKNDYLMPNISKLDTRTNAFLIMDKKWDDNAMREIVSGQLEYAKKKYAEDKTEGSGEDEPKKLSEDEVYAGTRRTLYIRVTESGGTVKAEARYTLSAYNYVKKNGNRYERMDICPCGGESFRTGTKTTSDCFCTYESAYVPFYSAEADANLKSLYVFYYPNYESDSSVTPLDEIVLDNTANYPLQLYITKQRDEENGTPTSVQENAYRMSLTVKESPSLLGKSNWNTNPGLYKAQTKLRTNLDYNISDLNKILSRPKISQMKLTYQAVSASGANERKLTGSAAKKVLDHNGLDDRKQSDRIYTAKVSIYKAGAAEKGFPESDRIAVLDSAKED